MNSTSARTPACVQVGPPASGSRREGRGEHHGPEGDRAADADPPGQRAGEHGAEQTAGGPDAEGEADDPGREPQLTTGEEDEERAGHQVEQVDRRGAGAARPAGRGPAGPGPCRRGSDAAARPRLVVSTGRSGTLTRPISRADTAKVTASTSIATGAVTAWIRPTGHRRARHERCRAGAAEQAVGLDELVASHEADEEARVGRLVEHLARLRRAAHREELAQRDRPEEVRHRQAEQDDAAQQVGHDEQPALAHLVVDPGADEERQQVRRPDRGGEQTHRRGARVQGGHRDERQRELGDPVAELRDALPRPVGREPAVAPERGLVGDGRRRRTSLMSVRSASGRT